VAQIYSDDQVSIEAYMNLGRMGNNCYVLHPATTGAGVTIVDAPEGIEAVIDALGDTPIERIVVTHSHFDHWLGFDALRAHTTAPVFASAEETNLEASRAIQGLADGETFNVGDAQVQVIHTPGHTPGSICFLANRAVLTGDTLFPGGPGRTRTSTDLATEIESITTRLHTLKPETFVLPGHGDTTTIEASRAEYAIFAAKDHPADLAGDVLWLES
jgi:hydroxyacylglutathione hydrolase